jgi:hypothetical protein
MTARTPSNSFSLILCIAHIRGRYIGQPNVRIRIQSWFFCLLLFEATFSSFLKIKSHKEVTHKDIGFSYYFCLMIERSGAGSRAGSQPQTNGSGSGSRRPKNVDPTGPDTDPQHCQIDDIFL